MWRKPSPLCNSTDFAIDTTTPCALLPGRFLAQTLLKMPPRNSAVSPDHLPPTSAPKTTRRPRPRSPDNSGCVLSFLLRASSNAAPSWSAALLRAVPSRCKGDTIVVSTANCAPSKMVNPSTTICNRMASTGLPPSMSRFLTKTIEDTRPPPSLHTCAAARSSANPLDPRTPASAHVARWWPRQSRRRPHRQVREEKGTGRWRRRHNNTERLRVDASRPRRGECHQDIAGKRGATFWGVQNALFFWNTTFREGGAYFGIQKLFLGNNKLFGGETKLFLGETKNFFGETKNFFW